MRGAVIYAPGDVRVEERPDPVLAAPTDAIIRLAATCVCGSDLWRWRGTDPVTEPTPMGHEYAGIAAAAPATAELLDRLTVEKLGVGAVPDERTGARFDALAPRVPLCLVIT